MLEFWSEEDRIGCSFVIFCVNILTSNQFHSYLKQIYTCSIQKARKFIQRMLNLTTRHCNTDKLRPVLNERVNSIPNIRKHQYLLSSGIC